MAKFIEVEYALRLINSGPGPFSENDLMSQPTTRFHIVFNGEPAAGQVMGIDDFGNPVLNLD